MVSVKVRLETDPDGEVRTFVTASSPLGTHRVPPAELALLQRDAEEFARICDGSHRPKFHSTELTALGHRLREVCFGPLWDGLVSALQGEASRDGRAFRLLVSSPDSALLNLPWELLPGRDGQFLLADARCTIRRTTLETLSGSPASLAAPPLRVLFVACAPTDQPGLDYEKEEEAILRIAQKLGGKLHLEIAEAGTFDELRELIVQHRPHIVHLSGHGSVHEGIGSFGFENESGRCDSRDAREMAAQLFAGQGVRLVFMNGCQTAQAAVAGVCQTLTAEGHVPLALGWGASIADDLATEFARVFFHEIAAGLPVDHAVAAARAELLARGRSRDGVVDLLDASFALPRLQAADRADALFDPRLPPDPPERPGVRYELLGDNIRGLREGFVGRRRQLQRTRPGLRSGDKNIVLLTGIGGAGKSTLATRLANRSAREGFRVVAVQARREEAAQFCLRLVTELATACQRLGRGGDETMLLDGQRPIENRLRLAVEILNEAKILLVLDNLESLLPLPPAAHAWELPEVAAFFSALTARLTGQGRAILTCRYFPAGFDPAQPNLAHEAMPDFTEADFFKYLRRHARVAERMDRGELSRELIETFHRKLGATPRFVEQASAILATLDADRLAEQLDTLATPAEGTAGDDLWQLQQGYFRDLFLPQLYDTLSAPHRLALSRLALVREALPLDGVARVAALESGTAAELVRRCVGLSLLQRFAEMGEVELFAVYPLQREFFTAPERLPEELRRGAHLAAAGFFRECYEKDREGDLGLSFMAELLACLHHATEAGDLDHRIWATTKLAWALIRRAEYAGALALVEPLLAESRHPDLLQIAARCASATGDWPQARKLSDEEQRERQAVGDRAGEAATWHQLATIDLNEGHYSAAREKFGKSLTIKQAIGDRSGEAKTWHQLATIDVKEGHYAAAREKFGQSLTIKQAIGDQAGEAATLAQLGLIDVNEGNYAAAKEKYGKAQATLQAIGDRAGEAATWHQLATIEVNEGDHAAARGKFGQSLTIKQAIGDRAGEAATWHQLASIDLKEGNYTAARGKFGQSLTIKQAIGDRVGEAATWHQLASLDDVEGNYAPAGEKFGQSLALEQAIGNRNGEAATFAQIAVSAWKRQNQAAPRLMAISFMILKAIDSADQKVVGKNLQVVASAMRLDQAGFDALLRESAEAYQRDRGAELVRQAFAGV